MEIALLPLVFYVLNRRIKYLYKAIKTKKNIGIEVSYFLLIIILITSLYLFIDRIISH